MAGFGCPPRVTTTLWLRIASAISLIFTAGHSMGGLKQWSPMGNNDVLKSMTEVHFGPTFA